jgi:hypothetical protein
VRRLMPDIQPGANPTANRSGEAPPVKVTP